MSYQGFSIIHEFCLELLAEHGRTRSMPTETGYKIRFLPQGGGSPIRFELFDTRVATYMLSNGLSEYEYPVVIEYAGGVTRALASYDDLGDEFLEQMNIPMPTAA
jgi:hypothetical protein